MNDLLMYDEKIKSIIDRKIVVYGLGESGKELVQLLEKYELLLGIIDNDLQKQLEGYRGYEVYSYNAFLKKKSNAFIVIATSEKNAECIVNQLSSIGFKEDIDYVTYDKFLSKVMPVVSYHSFNRLFVQLAQICVTERCTLKCKYCAHGCNKVLNDHIDMSIEQVKSSADYFFSHVDYIKEFVLIGGEPFLYKDLGSAIEYIGKRYRDKIMIFSITTNGTIVPDINVISLLKKYGVTVRISDYSSTLPYLRGKYEELKEKLIDVHTIFSDTHNTQWYDYGFGLVDNGSEASKLKGIFRQCATPCREIRGEKYYYCVMARSISENKKMNIGLDEYLDLSKIKEKREFFEFEMGSVKNGYLNMCRFCRGADAKKHLIPVAEQDTR